MIFRIRQQHRPCSLLFPVFKSMHNIGRDARKPDFVICEQFRRWPDCAEASLISAFVVRSLQRILSKRASCTISIFYLVFGAEQAGKSVTWSHISNTGFLALRPRYKRSKAHFNSLPASVVCRLHKICKQF